ncbi:hypothetical protein BDV06DRAFT_223048 [Aspergillus oleicola]
MATRTFYFLTAIQLQHLHASHLALNAPSQLAMLESANHAYIDGNKRTGILAVGMFLKINGYYLQKVPFADDEHNKRLADAHVAIVTNQMIVEQLAENYKSIAKAVEETTEIAEFKKGAVEY